MHGERENMNENNCVWLTCSICGEKFPLFEITWLDEPLTNTIYKRVQAFPYCEKHEKTLTDRGNLAKFVEKHLHENETIENNLGSGFYLLHDCMLDVYNECSRARAYYSLPFTERKEEDE